MKKWIPIFALILCCAIWGTTFVSIKEISNEIDPFLLSIFRNGIASFCLFIFILFSSPSKFKDRISLKLGVLIGLLSSGIYVVQTIGLKYTSSNHSAFITSSTVIIIPLLLVISGKQKLKFNQIIPILLITFGLMLLTNVFENQQFNPGDLITLFGTFICAFYIILSGQFVRKSEFLSLIFYQFFFATFFSIIGLGVNFYLTGTKLIFRSSSIDSVLYLSFFGTLFCFFITIWSQKFVSTIYTAMIFSLEPVFAAISSYFYIGEQLVKNEIIGAIIIISGLIYFNFLMNKPSQINLKNE